MDIETLINTTENKLAEKYASIERIAYPDIDKSVSLGLNKPKSIRVMACVPDVISGETMAFSRFGTHRSGRGYMRRLYDKKSGRGNSARLYPGISQG